MWSHIATRGSVCPFVVFIVIFFCHTCALADDAAPAAPVDPDSVKYTVVMHDKQRSKPFQTGRTMPMKNKSGKLFKCHIPILGEVEPAVDDNEPLGEAPVKKTISSLMSALAGRCLVRNEGYWNYELCHRKTLRQFHTEPNGARTEYSLGDFSTDSDISAEKSPDGQAVVLNNFVGGTRCDETNSGRHTEVQYRCGRGEKDHIESITEVAVCSYVVRFSSSALCTQDNGGTGGAKKALTVRDHLTPLVGACFYRVEGWWTYEFCYGKHVRQFHQENKVTTTDYSLGKFDEPSNARPDPVRPLDGSVAKYTQTYKGGTNCDLTNAPRKTEVEFVCSLDAHNVFASIKERASCDYVLQFHTQLICNHAAFQTDDDPVLQIDCYPDTSAKVS